jgi:hypothetical protein
MAPVKRTFRQFPLPPEIAAHALIRANRIESDSQRNAALVSAKKFFVYI